MSRFILMLSVLIIVIISSCGSDQNSELLSPYFLGADCDISAVNDIDGFSDECFIPLLLDDFSDNSNNWNLQTTSAYSHKIEQNLLKVSTHENESVVWGLSIPIEQFFDQGNFQYSVAFRIASILSGNEDRFNVVAWCSDEKVEKYQAFRFNSNNVFEFYQFEDGNALSHDKDTWSSGFFKSTSFTVLTVRQYNGMAYFFLNQELVHKLPENRIFGTKIFFGAPGGNEMHIDAISFVKLIEEGLLIKF